MKQDNQANVTSELIESMENEVNLVRDEFVGRYSLAYPNGDSTQGSNYRNTFLRDLEIKRNLLIHMAKRTKQGHGVGELDFDWKAYLGCGSILIMRRNRYVWGPTCGQTNLCPRCARKVASDMSQNAVEKFFRRPKNGKVYAVTLRLTEGGSLEVQDKKLRECRTRLMAMISDHRKPRSKPHVSWPIRALDLWWEVAWGGDRVNPHFHGLLHTNGIGDQPAITWIKDTWMMLDSEVLV